MPGRCEGARKTNARPPGSGTGLAAVVPPRFTTVSRRRPCVSTWRNGTPAVETWPCVTGASPAMPTVRSAVGMRGRRRVGTRNLRRTLARLGSRLGGHFRTGCRRRHHTSRGSLSRQRPSTRPRHRHGSLRRRGGTQNHHKKVVVEFTSLILRDSLPPELAPGAKRWLPGFKGPIPSTTLDERRVRFSC